MLNSIPSILDKVIGIGGKFVQDKDKLVLYEHEMRTQIRRYEQELLLAQSEINKADAQSGSFWQAGWRPYVAWGCGTAFLLQFLIAPLLNPWLLRWQYPSIASTDTVLTELLVALLGMAGLRSFEKLKGTAK